MAVTERHEQTRTELGGRVADGVAAEARRVVTDTDVH